MHVFNVIFDASDSIMKPNAATLGMLSDKAVTYCADAAGNPIFNANCAFITTP